MKDLLCFFVVCALTLMSFAFVGEARAAHKGKEDHAAHSHDPVDPEEAAMMEYVMKPAYRVYIAALTECSAPMRGMGANGKPAMNMDREKLQECMTDKGIPVNFDPTSMKGGNEKAEQAMRDQLKNNIDDIQQALDQGMVETAPPLLPEGGAVVPTPSVPAPVLEVGVIAAPAVPEEEGGSEDVPKAPTGASKVGKSRPAGQFWVPQTQE